MTQGDGSNIIMKKIFGYLKILTIVFVSIVILYEMRIYIHSRLHVFIAVKLRTLFTHWYFYESIIYVVLDFIIAFLGYYSIHLYKRRKRFSNDLLFIMAIPALFPIFNIGLSIVGSFFFKPCYIPEYLMYEVVISWILRIFFWVYAIMFALLVSLKVHKTYMIAFAFEYLVFLIYLTLFYAKILGPIKFP